MGFRLDSAKEIAVFRNRKEPDHNKIEDLFYYAFCLIYTVLNIESSMHLHSDDWKRTIYINTLGVSTFDFNINKTNKLKLIKSGKDCAEKYFVWYDRLKRLVNKPPIH